MFRVEGFFDAFKSALEDKDYIYLEPMNKSGGWGEIFYVYSREHKEIRVAKVYKEALGRITEEIYKSDAIKLMKIEHKNVVKIVDKSIIEYDDKKYFFLILEHIKGKNFEEIDSRLFFEKPHSERLGYFMQALDGINEFRENFDLHRDLHPGNIILSEEDKNKVRTIKIIDPGSSRYYYEPEDEDIDLYSIKEGLINLFLQPEEIKQINEKFTLKDLDFPEFRQLIKKLYNKEIRKIYLTFLDDSIEYHIPHQQIKIYSEEEIRRKKEEIKSEYLYVPLKGNKQNKLIYELTKKFPLPGIKKISEEDWLIYNECVELYSEKYGEYLVTLNEYNQEMSKYCSLGFNVHNGTNFTFYDITAYIGFPEGLEIQNKALKDPPEEPKLPPRLKMNGMTFNRFTYDFGTEIRKYREELKKIPSILSEISTFLMPDITPFSDSPFKILDDGRLQIKRANLTQYHYFEIPEYDFQIMIKRKIKN